MHEELLYAINFWKNPMNSSVEEGNK